MGIDTSDVTECRASGVDCERASYPVARVCRPNCHLGERRDEVADKAQSPRMERFEVSYDESRPRERLRAVVTYRASARREV